MSSVNDFISTGKIIAFKDGIAVFVPRGTNYEMYLKTSSVDLPLGTPVNVRIRISARKLWTVPSGGNFVTPIFGPPRIVQGRVRHAENRALVVHATANFIVDLPAADTALDLTEGAITVNRMVNVVALPGAAMDFIGLAGAGAQATGAPPAEGVGAGPGPVPAAAE
jgi:hypothetical protein